MMGHAKEHVVVVVRMDVQGIVMEAVMEHQQDILTNNTWSRDYT